MIAGVFYLLKTIFTLCFTLYGNKNVTSQKPVTDKNVLQTRSVMSEAESKRKRADFRRINTRPTGISRQLNGHCLRTCQRVARNINRKQATPSPCI